MSENLTPEVTGGDGTETAPVAPPPPKRGPGHRGQDIRDTMAEMAAKAHEISLEAGSKMASAMRDVIGAAAGISAFAIESARDLVNYMVRRGQMSQEEATKLLREVEEAHARRPKIEVTARSEAPRKSEIHVKVEAKAKEPGKIIEKPAPPVEKLVVKGPEKPAAKAAAPPKAPAKPLAKAAQKPKTVAKPPAKAVAAKPAAKKPATKKK